MRQLAIVGRRELEVGSRKSGDGRWEMEVQSWKLEVGSRKSDLLIRVF
ncbi:MAG: hypothetical protein M1419_04455 [Bacteroidetes bacterium]|nr:hypothetical protein [Bacteroidota bacterium]